MDQMKKKPLPPRVFKVGTFPCPYCQGTFDVKDRSTEKGVEGFEHSLPACAIYRLTPAIEFITVTEDRRVSDKPGL
jgi:hypothetical protein